MVTHEYILSAALRCDTTMSRAFLRALGVDIAMHPVRHMGGVISVETACEFDELEECFKNYGSPMDW